MARKKKGKGKISIIAVVVVIIALILGFGSEENTTDTSDNASVSSSQSVTKEKEVFVHFIDVGQGSSALIQSGNKGVLIDAAESVYGEYIVDYINDCGVDTLDYVVASHPHSDHIGGMCDVLNGYTVSEIIMPELEELNTPTTKVYEKLLDCIIEKDISVTSAEVGDTFQWEGISVEILGPVEQVKDLNNMSVICKVDAFGSEFMFLADAEKPELDSVYEAVDANFSADVIAMGHHGSRTSIHEDFLGKVDADIAVISCGRGNSYGHPHQEVLDYIEENDMELLRTDYEGDIVFRCTEDGLERVEV